MDQHNTYRIYHDVDAHSLGLMYLISLLSEHCYVTLSVGRFFRALYGFDADPKEDKANSFRDALLTSY